MLGFTSRRVCNGRGVWWCLFLAPSGVSSSGAPSLALPSPSLHAAAARWVLEPSPLAVGPAAPSAAARLAAREPATRAFAAPIALGTLSAPAAALAAAVTGGAASKKGSSATPMGRLLDAVARPRPAAPAASQASFAPAGAAALGEAVEWAEWHRLLARRDLAEGLAQSSPTAGAGEVRYWRWHGEHLVRYRLWEATAQSAKSASGQGSSREEPVLVLVHG